MYLDYFGLTDHPFRLNPDSRFLYLSKAHAQAKAYMEYTIWNRDSFVVVTGEIGCGKTTLIQKVLADMDQDVIVAKIHQTQLTEVQLLQVMLAEFGIEAFKASKVQALNRLNKFLREQNALGKRVVLVVDEAQNLQPRVLEEIRLLSGLETDSQASLNVILAGQPELNDTLDAPGMEQLVQRVRLRFHLGALSQQETQEYIQHRLKTAGLHPQTKLFADELMDTIFEYTNGVPRLINNLCDTALTCAYAEERRSVDAEMLANAIAELRWVPYQQRKSRLLAPLLSTPASVAVPAVVPRQAIGRLVVKVDKEVLGEYLLHKESMTIGRNLDNDICIDDAIVSSYHARIITRGDESYICDLNSTNGTYVNMSPADQWRPLKSGDVINITKYKIKYTLDQSLGEAGHGPQTRKLWRDTLNTAPRAAANDASTPSTTKQEGR